jgi:undecaprenyl-diphosphatase
VNSLQATVLAALQGATELFPVSSLGHAVLLPALAGWHLERDTRVFLPFLVMLHLGTAAALLLYFYRDWWLLALGVLGLADTHQVAESRRVFLLIVVATIPAIVIGFVLEHFVRRLFGTPVAASIFLIANGALLLVGERLRSRGRRTLDALTPVDAVLIGLWQCLAFMPGLSRSGATMVGGLLRGIDHEDAAHFSFLIATPVILGAAVIEVPKLMRAGVPHDALGIAVMGAVVAGATAFASTAFLMRYFRRHDVWALAPFAWYCVALGAGGLAILFG